MTQLLDREEYVEQAYFFRLLSERLKSGVPLQDLLLQTKDEVLATTRLPLALDFLLSELKHAGVMSTAMRRLAHYFSSFQTFIVGQAEEEGGRFDMDTALRVLEKEAAYRADAPTCPGSFMFQFETLCRNRLNYDAGLSAMADDPIYPAEWRDWVLTVRRQIGIVDLADLIYVRSEYYRARRRRHHADTESAPVLFGEKEGKIAWANRRKDPLFLFAALQRHLGYPTVPKRQTVDQTQVLLPQLIRRMQRLEQRVKLLEEEQRGGIDLSQFMPDARGAIPPDYDG